jgi:hypothetical protein
MIVMNGWKFAPHCWRTFLLRPIRVERTPFWWAVDLFGFAFFFEREQDQ